MTSYSGSNDRLEVLSVCAEHAKKAPGGWRVRLDPSAARLMVCDLCDNGAVMIVAHPTVPHTEPAASGAAR